MSSLHFVSSLVAALRRENRLDRLGVERLQQRRLARLLRSAMSSPFQAERLRQVDWSAPSLERVPSVATWEMMRSFPDTLCGERIELSEVQQVAAQKTGSILVRGRYPVSQTSGTTGEPAFFLNDARSWDIQRAVVFARTFRDRLAWRHVRRFLRRRYRMAFVVSGLQSCISTQTCLDGSRQARLFSDIRLFAAEQSVSDIVRQLNDFQPDYVHGYANLLELLAYRAEDGDLRIRPEFMSSGSEAFSQSGRAAVLRAFPGTVLTSQYGATECTVLGNECRAGNMHVNSDYVVLEAVDESGCPVPAGVRSHHTLLTSLINRFQPMIRFRLTDSITYWPEACSCGSPLPVITLEGRSDNIIWLERGPGDFVVYHPLAFQCQMYQVSGIRQWQVDQQERNRLLIRYVPAPGADAVQVGQQIQRQWSGYLGEERLQDIVQIVTQSVSEIPRSSTSQKARQILTAVGPPAGRGGLPGGGVR